MNQAIGDLDLVVEAGRPVIAMAPRLRGRDAAAGWLAEHRPAIRAALNLAGSLLVRGLPIGGVEDFAAVRDALIDEPFGYREKATPRSDLGSGVYSSTDLPAAQEIRLHNENSYTLSFAGVLLLACLTPAAEGGATPVADTREVLAHIPAELVARFREVGYTLYRNYHPHLGLPWSTAFGAGARAEVEDFCLANAIAWRWLDDARLVTSQRRSALIRHPSTADELWFNHVAFWNEFSLDDDVREVLRSSYGPDGLPFNTGYGDGTPLTPADADALNAAYQAALRREPWRAGDLLVLDNLLSCHGRDAFSGDRRVVVAMGQPVRIEECSPSSAVEPGPLPG